MSNRPPLARRALAACAGSATCLAALSLAVAALFAASTVRSNGSETCYDFGNQLPGAQWPVAVKTDVPIGIGHIRVHPLKLNGVVQAPRAAKFHVADSTLAGGSSPELAGTAVAVQMLPKEGVSRISLRYAHQPEADEGRAASMEVNGVRRDWQGSFEHLNTAHLGKAGHPARFTVTPSEAAGAGPWKSGTLVVESRDPIRSFTLGAAALRIDNVCFTR